MGFSQLNTKQRISGPTVKMCLRLVALDSSQVNHDKQPFAAISHIGEGSTNRQSDAARQLECDLFLAFHCRCCKTARYVLSCKYFCLRKAP